MDLYQHRKKHIDENIIVSFSSIGIANLCDYVICDRFDDTYGKTNPFINVNYINNLNDGDKLFLNGFNLQKYSQIVTNIVNLLKTKNIKINFYIGVIEPVLNNNIIDSLLPVSKNIYVTNNIHPKCKILPIGLRDGEEVHPNHKNFSGQQILDEMKIFREKTYLCLLCFSNSTHITRVDCENKLRNKSFVFNLNNTSKYNWSNKGGNINSNNDQSIHCGATPQWIFYENCHKSFYTLSPRGAGEDTHRFFEAIALNSIPIVKKTNTSFDETFNFFPCLVVNNWEEVTEQLLADNLKKKQEELYNFHSTFPDFLINKETILQILDNL